MMDETYQFLNIRTQSSIKHSSPTQKILKIMKKSSMLIEMEESLNLILNLLPLRPCVEEGSKSHNILLIRPQLTIIILQEHIRKSLCKTMGNPTLPSIQKIKILKGAMYSNKLINLLPNLEDTNMKATILNQE